MRGVYHELTLPVRSVHAESFDDFPGQSIATAVFTEHNGVTTILYPSREVRDAVIKSGMEQGVSESYDRLAELFNPKLIRLYLYPPSFIVESSYPPTLRPEINSALR